MTIPCTKCSERMPPDDDSYVIMQLLTHSVTQVVKGSQINHIYAKLIPDQWQWTPYTPEAWAELNRK